MAITRKARVCASRLKRARVTRVVVATLLVLALLPITWALAFPEPNDRKLCPPDRTSPPRLSSQTPPAPDSELGSPVVRILNPMRATTPPKVSDKYDGVDRRYHINAVARGLPSEAVVELYAVTSQTTEIVLGTLCPVRDTRDTFEGFWDIPETFREGIAELRIKAFDRPGEGAQVLASDQVRVDIQHRDAAAPPASENVTILWPLNDGPLGFFRNKAGEWKGNVEAIGGTGFTGAQVRYSTTALGAEPSFGNNCSTASSNVTRSSDSAKIFNFTCKLAAGDRPSSVTAIAVVAQNGNDSSDVHRVHPFIQQTSDMQMSLVSVPAPANQNATQAADQPSGRRRRAGTDCLTFEALVRDQFGRPVYGANVDVQLRGPSDTASFGSNTADAAAPDKAASTESGVTCTGGVAPTFRQSRSVVPDGPDVKGIESATIGTNDSGKWTFSIFSSEPGFAKITAWVDDEPLASDTSERPTDNDVPDGHESAGTIEAQWLEAPVVLDLSPAGETSSVGSCRMYTLSLISGSAVLADFNVDLHVRGPDPEVRLCGEGAGVLHQPDSGHDSPSHEPGSSPFDPCPPVAFNVPGPPCHHLEGTTNEDGELVFGMSSLSSGTVSIRAWADGEPDQNNDQPGSKAFAAIDTKWLSDVSESTIKLVAPSPEFHRVSSDSYKIIARVGAPYLVERVPIEVSSSAGKFFLGDAVRVGDSNVYELVWDLTRPFPTAGAPSPGSSGSPAPSSSPSPSASSSPNPLPTAPAAGTRPGIPDGSYTIIARVNESLSIDTNILEVNRNLNPQANDTTGAYEIARLTSPKNGDALGFVGGVTSLAGSTSPGAEGVDLWYTTSGISEKPVWRSCGFVLFDNPSFADRTFVGACRLRPTDNGSEVTGVGAVAFNCGVAAPGCAHPSPTPLAPGVNPPPRGTDGGAKGAGQAVAVSGCNGSPCMVLQPSDWEAVRDTCVAFSVLVAEQNRRASSKDVAVEFQGPSDRIRFCTPGDDLSDDWLGEEFVTANPYGLDLHRVAGKTNDSGAFRFGVFSTDSNFKSIFSVNEDGASRVTAWLDDGDGTREEGEDVASAAVHWELPGRCTIVGTDKSEVIFGTPRDDKICALGGNDKIFALEGDDIVLGGEGNDVIYGEDGNDFLYGEAGDDSLFGGVGRDHLDGGEGTDACDLGSGRRQVMTACERITPKTRRAPARAI